MIEKPLKSMQETDKRKNIIKQITITNRVVSKSRNKKHKNTEARRDNLHHRSPNGRVSVQSFLLYAIQGFEFKLQNNSNWPVRNELKRKRFSFWRNFSHEKIVSKLSKTKRWKATQCRIRLDNITCYQKHPKHCSLSDRKQQVQ